MNQGPIYVRRSSLWVSFRGNKGKLVEIRGDRAELPVRDEQQKYTVSQGDLPSRWQDSERHIFWTALSALRKRRFWLNGRSRSVIKRSAVPRLQSRGGSEGINHPDCKDVKLSQVSAPQDCQKSWKWFWFFNIKVGFLLHFTQLFGIYYCS